VDGIKHLSHQQLTTAFQYSAENLSTTTQSKSSSDKHINNLNMHFSTIVIALAGATTAMATAIPGKSSILERQTAIYIPCSGTTAQCCAVDVLGVADLDCAQRMSSPTMQTCNSPISVKPSMLTLM
jgi:hypothetical protein